MNNTVKCEKCGGIMLPIDNEKPIGMICQNCGLSIATSYFEHYKSDETIYTISITGKIDSTKDNLKVLSTIVGQNFINTKRLIDKAPITIYSGKANEVIEIRGILDSNKIPYRIVPLFPY